MPSQRLRRYRRIRERATLEKALRAGQVARTPFFRMCYLSGDGPPGVAFLAGKRVGGAVRRNRAKRVLREAFRKNQSDLSGIETLVFVATERASGAREHDIRRALQKELDRISTHDS